VVYDIEAGPNEYTVALTNDLLPEPLPKTIVPPELICNIPVVAVELAVTGMDVLHVPLGRNLVGRLVVLTKNAVLDAVNEGVISINIVHIPPTEQILTVIPVIDVGPEKSRVVVYCS